MFEDSLVESAALLRTHNRWPAVLSITTQLCVAALILALPLLHPELLPMQHLLPATLAPPRAPAPPPPPMHLEARSTAAATSAPATPTTTRATQIFRDLIHPTGPPAEAPTLTSIDLGKSSTSLPPGINSAAPAAPHVSARPAASPSSKLLNLSSGITAGHLIAPIRPEYPAIARTAGIEGTVVVQAIISRTGVIESAHVVSGPIMLQPAALDAVRQARYHPFLLNGQPTDVQTTITITFRMRS
ncbi:MAG TPA: energy transducer TonB [Acidobacteriaceae bacterium]|nr:energy transducer TonB [Acidobacteriaceae bacterium]